MPRVFYRLTAMTLCQEVYVSYHDIMPRGFCQLNAMILCKAVSVG